MRGIKNNLFKEFMNSQRGEKFLLKKKKKEK
jgi:hypothetical protein